MTTGEKIWKLRKARGWSQEELADKIGVTRQAVSRWESGSAKPDADKIVAICDLFGVSADYLLRQTDQGESGGGNFETKTKTTALGDAIRGMTLKQWGSLGLLVGGLAVMLLMKLVYIFGDTTYYYTDIFDVTYTGFQGFLKTEEVSWFWYGGIAAAAIGGFCLIPIPEGIRKWFHDGWEDIKTMFDFF